MSNPSISNSQKRSTGLGKLFVDRQRLLQQIEENFPSQLKRSPQWALFKWGKPQANGKLGKIPIQPDGTPAKSNDPMMWDWYERIITAFGRGVGDMVGFAFISAPDLNAKADPGYKDAALYAGFRAALASGERRLEDYLTGLAGIDLDGCRNLETGEFTLEARAVIETFPDWYTEISPSSTGGHLIGFSDLVLDRGKKCGWVETYNTGRLFTVTGNYYAGEQFELGNHTKAHEVLYEKYISYQGRKLKIAPKPSQNGASPLSGAGFQGSDRELIVKAQQAKNGAQFSAL